MAMHQPSSSSAVRMERQLFVPVSHGAHSLLLLSTTSQTANMLPVPNSPGGFARLIIGAALAFGAMYALLSSSATAAPSDLLPAPPALPPSPTSSSGRTISRSTPAVSEHMAVLRTPEQFDSFVLASNRAGYLCIVLWCAAPSCAGGKQTEAELHRLSSLFAGRRIVFARVDCSIQSDGARQQRCDLTQLHRVHKTPTVRMYYSNSCVDEPMSYRLLAITGCRPVEIRQAASDLSFKFGL
ncbi:hypothetical protein TSOC_011135 [Tetrabaena socialis]|uniref:Thioredoxin domain-containing protein n=1 Tax=Tetrabaena socialis TaxID=47790 RepID=A0A2J7ZRF9_9CHLO|nr:hypothetical protein TSOC_011135 [Tetrabaena socialis]|eukprot:PNH02852.1 hypothetical protein TSOC_011135 [Tetrabaena socialis]